MVFGGFSNSSFLFCFVIQWFHCGSLRTAPGPTAAVAHRGSGGPRPHGGYLYPLMGFSSKSEVSWNDTSETHWLNMGQALAHGPLASATKCNLLKSLCRVWIYKYTNTIPYGRYVRSTVGGYSTRYAKYTQYINNYYQLLTSIDRH